MAPSSVCSPSMRRSLLVGLLAAHVATANVDTYPIKSINLDAAMDVTWYNGYNTYGGLIPGISEFHAVNGVEVSDGGFVACGTGSRSDGTLSASAVKVDANGVLKWAWVSSANPSRRASAFANAVVELPASFGGGLLLAGAVIDEEGVAYRHLTKLSFDSGDELWNTSAFGDARGSSGGWEMLSATSSSVILSGFDRLDCGTRCIEELAFKSGGITYGGRAVVTRLPISTFSDHDAPPSGATIDALLAAGKEAWSVTPDGYATVRSARPTPDGAHVVGLLRNPDTGHVALTKLSYATGAVVWEILCDASIGEGTAIAISDDGNVAMTGLSQTAGRYPRSVVTVGRLSLFRGTDGSLEWTRSYTVGGVPELIRHECWGVVAMPKSSGYAITCGTGIEPEMCNRGLPPAVRKNCTAGVGDNRPGAIPRPPDVWQSMVVMADAAGNLLWQRVDSYRPHKDPQPLGQNGGSAAEWGTLTSEGGMLVMMDDPAAGSLGLMMLAPKGSLALGLLVA